MFPSEVQRLTVESRSNVLILSETSGNVVEQYQPITNEQVPIWAVELYNGLTADLDGMKALVSESILKSVDIQPEMPQLVDAYRSMVSNQNTFYDQMHRGVVTLCHNVYVQQTEIILQSQIFVANVKGGMAVIAAKASQDDENLKDTLHAQIPSNNSARARIAAVHRETRRWEWVGNTVGSSQVEDGRTLVERWQSNGKGTEYTMYENRGQ